MCIRDSLIGVIGSKAECVKIKSDITKYMEENLKLELSQEKTLITNAQKPAKFLGFDVSVRKSDAIKRDKNNVPARYYNGKIVLKVAIETVRNKLEEYSAIRYKVENGRQVWFAKFRGNLMKKKIEDIVAAYNSEIRGFYNYYCIANNVAYALSKFGYIMEYSMYPVSYTHLDVYKRQGYTLADNRTLPTDAERQPHIPRLELLVYL